MDHRRVIFLGVLVPNGFIHGFPDKGQSLREVAAQHVLVIVPHKAEQIPGGQHRLAGVGVRSQQPGRVYHRGPLRDPGLPDLLDGDGSIQHDLIGCRDVLAGALLGGQAFVSQKGRVNLRLGGVRVVRRDLLGNQSRCIQENLDRFGNFIGTVFLRRRIALLGMLVLLQSADQGFRFAFGIAVPAVDMVFRRATAQNPLAGDIARIRMYVAFLIGGARQDRLARDIAVLAVDMVLLHAADQIAYRFIALLRVGVRFFAADQLTPICRQIIQLRRHRSGWQQADTHHQGKEQGESALAKGLEILHAINSSFLCKLVRMQSIRRPGCHSFSAVGPIALRPVISGGLLILQPGWPGACAR